MVILCLVLGIAFCIVGILFLSGNGLNLIKAWRNTAEQEKEKIDAKGLSRNVGAIIGIAGIILLATGIFPAFKQGFFIWSMIAWFILTGLDLYCIQKYKWYTNQKGGTKNGRRGQ